MKKGLRKKKKMKTRTGFVSNSSSSSFVIIGLTMTKKVEKKLQELYPISDDKGSWWDELEEKTGLDVLYDEPDSHIGKLVACVSTDECLDNEETPLSDLLDDIAEVRTKLETIGPIKVIQGYCPS
jgi:hypothetical protein